MSMAPEKRIQTRTDVAPQVLPLGSMRTLQTHLDVQVLQWVPGMARAEHTDVDKS
jgi:hypothetical protein